ncbi:MAG: M55 family metallopeptidase [Candidatus Bathyarchaeota archaeon]|nr:MAG: M55 family metallopeptidase [Candidatus Bathyarchaeota archaeon]
MVGDVNAAIEGAMAAGAEEITVSDSHGRMRNIHPWEINEAAQLVRGSPKPNGMMAGISGDYDAVLHVGYHAMNGAENAILGHTMTLGVDAVYVNGRQTGEFGLNAALAGWHGVPSVFVSGDQAVAAEAESFIPDIHKAVVKWGIGRYSAKCLPPSRSTVIIRKTVTEALKDISSIKPFKVEEPVEVRLKLVNVAGADAASILPYAERLDGRTLKAVFDDYPSALNGVLAAIFMASLAARR